MGEPHMMRNARKPRAAPPLIHWSGGPLDTGFDRDLFRVHLDSITRLDYYLAVLGVHLDLAAFGAAIFEDELGYAILNFPLDSASQRARAVVGVPAESQ